MGNLSPSRKSLLPENVIAILNKLMRKGFNYDFLDLSNKMMPEICEWIIKLGDKVKKLGLDKNQITSVGASMLFDTLKTINSSIKDISLNGNKQIDDKCMKSLGEYIKSNKSIEKISLSDTNISDAGIEILASYLDANTTFKELNLSWNQGITDKSFPLLMKMIESSCIEDISIYNTSITQKNMVYASLGCNSIKNGSTIIYLHGKGINDDDLIKICDAMKKYGINKLNYIDLRSNKITSKGASVLFGTLKECKSVVSDLNLTANQIDDECMKSLGEYFQDNEHVEYLGLACNKITDKGVEILSEYLIGNTTLKVLHFIRNEGITDASVPCLIEIANRSCIMRLTLGDASISEEKKQEINEALSTPIKEREIPIKSNTKSAAKISLSSAST